MQTLAHKAWEVIRRYGLFDPGERVVVGVSGGPDSVVLLHVLKEFAPRLCLSLHVAHLDHQVRRGSRADYRFVEKLSASLGVIFFGGVLARGKISKKGSLEEQLRVHRYRFLTDVCRKTRSGKLALAHTRDDQAETVLMRMIRGSGLYGLSAIQPKLSLDGIEVVRPFIEISKKEVLREARSRRWAFKTDATNFEQRFFRNKIRRRLLPLLEKQYNPNIREVLSGMAQTIGADYAYLAGEAAEFLDRHRSCRRGRCSIALSHLAGLPISLRRLALRLAASSNVLGARRCMSFRHLEEIEDLIFLRPADSEVHLPDGIIVQKTSKNLVIFKR